MKTLGRILIILAAFILVMGMTYVAVNASSSSSTVPAFERGGEGFPRPEGIQPRFPEGERPDFDREGPRRGGWIFGLIKNVGILVVIVALIAVPKSWIRRKNTAAQVE